MLLDKIDKKKVAIGTASVSSFFMLIVLCLFLILALTINNNEFSNEHISESTMQEFIDIAINECILVNGNKGGDKYRKWYTGKADGANWCATFVSWCADQAGIIDAAVPKFEGCDAGVSWYKNKNQFDYTRAYGGNGTPSKGQLIFFCKGNKNDSTHVGIITKVENNIIYTVEGNTSNTIKEKTYSIDNPKKNILGYATVNYPTNSNNQSDFKGSLSEAFKFFAKFESGKSYDQGFSSGDKYHALGYYQFDNRYDLQEFLRYCYNSDTSKYSLFKPYLSCSKNSLANNKNLESAWKQAFKNDPFDFACKQDEFEYNNYYVPVEQKLKKKGIDISNRSDAVKGMACSLSNWAGTTNGAKIIDDSKVKNDLSDKEFVTKVYDYLYSLKYSDYQKYGKTGKKYYNGWHNRWKKEKEECLKYL